jgi:xylulokinase
VYRQVLADLTGRVVTVPALDEAVATGACIQAAAVLLQQQPADLAASWGMHEGDLVEPGPGDAAGEIRAAYRDRRDREG